MKEIVKYIRSHVEMSQEEFASAIGTTSITVNRWEKGRSVPSVMAQNSLFRFCTERHIALADFVIDGLKPVSGTERQIVYHGSRNGLKGKIAPISRDKCDFGSGFYTGTDPFQPLTLICDEPKPTIYALEFNPAEVNVLHVTMGLEWALLIAFYRGYMDSIKGSKLYEKYAHLTDGYDIVIGFTANDRMYQTLTDFFNRVVTDTVMIKSLSALKLGTQYVAITQKGCDAFTIVKEHTLSPLELMALKEKSIQNRKNGIALAEEMRDKYRRQGQFFDEILREK